MLYKLRDKCSKKMAKNDIQKEKKNAFTAIIKKK